MQFQKKTMSLQTKNSFSSKFFFTIYILSQQCILSLFLQKTTIIPVVVDVVDFGGAAPLNLNLSNDDNDDDDNDAVPKKKK